MEYDHDNGRGGDHAGGASSPVDDTNDPYRRVTEDSDRVAAGYHVRLRPGSDVVAFFSHGTDSTTSDNPRYDQVYDDSNQLIGYGHLTGRTHNPYFTYQAAHLLNVSKFRFRYGIKLYRGRQQSTSTETLSFFALPGQTIPYSSDTHDSAVRFGTAFAQASYIFNRALAFTAGVDYDWANHDDILLIEPRSKSQWDPYAGVIYNPVSSASFRFACMRVLQTDFQEGLASVQVAGFALNQNEAPLTASRAYAGAWDQQIGRSTFVRTTGFRRYQSVPAGVLCELVSCRGELYGGNVAINRMLTDRWTAVADWSLTHASDPFGLRHDSDAKVGTYYIHPRGYSFRLQEEYFHQRGFSRGVPGVNPDVPAAPSVFLTNIAVAYELPRKRGLLSLTVSDLTNRRYAFLADPLALDQRIPSRQVVLAFHVIQ